MPWRGPDYDGEFPSLGWDVLDWAERYLKVPDGPKAGEQLVLTDEQARIVVRFYGLDDRGRFLFRRAAVRRSQGWGKSPLLALIGAAELCGPTRFGGWNSQGEPVSMPPHAPWVQVAAVSEDQTDNTYAALHGMLAESDLNGSILDVGLTRTYLLEGFGRLEPVTASAGSRLGQRTTFGVLDETHLWVKRNGGLALGNVIRRNAGKMAGRTFESTNAHLPGEDSVAERTWRAAQSGSPGLLYDSVEAPSVADLGDRAAVLGALQVAYGDSALERGGWVDLERLADEIADPATDAADARRFYFNQLVAAVDQAVDPAKWEAACGERAWPDEGDRVGLGFDGSISDDTTALVGCTAEGHLFTIKVWERPDRAQDWSVPRLDVDREVRAALDRWRVGRMLCDIAKWKTDIERWQLEYDQVLAFDTTKTSQMALACDRFTTALATGMLSHDGTATLTSHVLAMARRKVRLNADDLDGRTPYVFVKSDTRKIDAGIAAVLALEAAIGMLEPELVPAESDFFML